MTINKHKNLHVDNEQHSHVSIFKIMRKVATYLIWIILLSHTIVEAYVPNWDLIGNP